jgi:choice-of-anchor A domain-containing protein/uncharacterized repeat protein (TIGR01451 family)
VVVELRNSSGALLSTTATNASGHYLFDRLVGQRCYEVRFVIDSRFWQFTVHNGSVPVALDSDVLSTVQTPPFSTTGLLGSQICLGPSASNLTIDAGLVVVPSFSMMLVSTCQPQTTTAASVAIGETATFEIQLELPAGAMQFCVAIDVPSAAGMPLLNIVNASIFSVGSALISTGVANGTAAVLSDTNSDLIFDHASFVLGPISAPSPAASSPDLTHQVLVRVTVYAPDVPANIAGVQLDIVAHLGCGSSVPSASAVGSLNLTESELLVHKTSDVNATLDGDIVYTIIVQHSNRSSYDALAVSLSDVIDSQLTYQTGTLTSNHVGSVSLNQRTINGSLSVLPLGAVWVVQFTVAAAFTQQAREVDNVALLSWRSSTCGPKWRAYARNDTVPVMVGCVNSGFDTVPSLFNAFVFDTLSMSTDAEGRIAAGGAMTLTNVGVASKLYPSQTITCPQIAAAGDYVPSVVGGSSVQYSSGRVYGGSIIYGTSGSIGATLNAGCSSSQNASAIDFAFWRQRLIGNSALLSTRNSTAVSVRFRTGTYTLTGNYKPIEVFYLDAASLLQSRTFVLNGILSSVSTIVFNVRGTSGGLADISLTGLPGERKVIWNFFEATTLTLSGVNVHGSILAPFANVTTQSGNIDGQLIANSFAGPLELHWVPFTGCLPV